MGIAFEESQLLAWGAMWFGGLTGLLSRQDKLGASCRVEVPVGQGLATHPYRVLHLQRSQEVASWRTK